MSLSKLKSAMGDPIRMERGREMENCKNGETAFHVQTTPVNHKLYENLPREITTFTCSDDNLGIYCTKVIYQYTGIVNQVTKSWLT